MIEREFLEKTATKKQTSFLNVAREYAELAFLSFFYQLTGSEQVLFKGGTALRLVFGSPRYSEDLDFSAPHLYSCQNYKDLLQEVLVSLDREGFSVDIAESKSTTGGCIAVLDLELAGKRFVLKTDVSLRKDKELSGEVVVVKSDLYQPFSVSALSASQLLKEKLAALLTRQKPRDFFDLYFILRSQRLRQELELSADQRKQILQILDRQSKRDLEADLRELLPQTFHSVIADFPKTLYRELGS